MSSAPPSLRWALGLGLSCTCLLLLYLATGDDHAVSEPPRGAGAGPAAVSGRTGEVGVPPARETSGGDGATRSDAAGLRAENEELRQRVKGLEAENAALRQQVASGGGGGGPPAERGGDSGVATAPVAVESCRLTEAQVARALQQHDKERSAMSFWAQRDAQYPRDAGGAAGPRTFRQISDRMRDDKSFRHRYDVAYSLYLEPLRGLSERLSVFEIGLGCDQERIGASVMMWGEYLPRARLSVFEYDAACGKRWAAEHAKLAPSGGFNIYFGDQASEADLQRALKADGDRQYDVIIDDGGHSMQQQLVSFRVLWPRVKRGGVYVVEDLNSSFKSRYGGNRRPDGPPGAGGGVRPATMTNFLKDLTDQLHALPVPHHAGKFVEDVEFKSPIARVDCHHFICFITKRL